MRSKERPSSGTSPRWPWRLCLESIGWTSPSPWRSSRPSPDGGGDRGLPVYMACYGIDDGDMEATPTPTHRASGKWRRPRGGDVGHTCIMPRCASFSSPHLRRREEARRRGQARGGGRRRRDTSYMVLSMLAEQ
jgi:hypothetical protein